jgi:putative intracellular protease/amidase
MTLHMKKWRHFCNLEGLSMKRTLFLLTCVVAFVCTSTLLHAQGVKKGKVLLILREGKFLADVEFMLNNEVDVITNLLNRAGLELKVASPSGQPIVAAAKTLKPDLKLSDVKMADYAGFIIPCISIMDPLPAGFVPSIKDAIAKGKPVAAQTGGVFALAQAGVLSGKKYSGVRVPDKKRYPGFKDAIYSGTGIVQDGHLITSAVCPMTAKQTGLPDGTTLFAQAFIAELLKKSR